MLYRKKIIFSCVFLHNISVSPVQGRMKIYAPFSYTFADLSELSVLVRLNVPRIINCYIGIS
jgi:hypothetical protein